MNTIDDLTLQECDLEDIEDIIPKIEKSFNLKFQRTEFTGLKLFGETKFVNQKKTVFFCINFKCY
jgi:hypothetical protein